MVKVKVSYWELFNEVFASLNNMKRSWGASIEDGASTDALTKQALNTIAAFIIACNCEHRGNSVDWNKLPKIAISRALEKFFVRKDTPDHIFDEVFACEEISKSEIQSTAKEMLVEKTDNELKEFLYDETENSYEMKVYRAATKVASYVELLKSEIHISKIEFAVKKQQTREALRKFFKDFPIVEEIAYCESIDSLQVKKDLNDGEKLLVFLNTVLKLKNQVRWVDKARNVGCSVHGHLFDTAVIAYFMAIEQYEEENLATQLFFTGVFHDVAETWTTDIASPVKGRIKNLRKATETYELKMLNEHIYNFFPKHIGEKIKGVSMEEPINEKYKKFMKGADYFSADLECLRQLVGGARDIYYYNVIMKGKYEIETGEVNITPTSNILRNRIYDYAENLMKAGVFFKWSLK